jgi:hypothetical protein
MTDRAEVIDVLVGVVRRGRKVAIPAVEPAAPFEAWRDYIQGADLTDEERRVALSATQSEMLEALTRVALGPPADEIQIDVRRREFKVLAIVRAHLDRDLDRVESISAEELRAVFPRLTPHEQDTVLDLLDLL